VRKTIKKMLAEYGLTAVVIYLITFCIVLFGVWGAIRLGWQVGGLVQNVGAFTAAYLSTKVARPARIAVTLAVTPLVVRWLDHLRGRTPAAERAGIGAAEEPRGE
jgi:hypothetical protein